MTLEPALAATIRHVIADGRAGSKRDERCGMVTQLKPTEAAMEEESVTEPTTEKRRPAIVSVAGLVRGVDVEVKNGLVGAVIAADDVELERSITRSAFAGGGLKISQAISGTIMSGGDAHVENGGAQAILAAGSITMESAGTGFAVARRIRVAHGGTAVFAITPNLEVQEGGRVLFGRGVSFAVLGGISSLVALLIFAARRRAARTAAS